MKRKLRIIKNTLLLTSVLFAGLYTLIYVLALDSLSIEGILKGGIVACVCSIWVCLFLLVNYPEEVSGKR